MSELNQFPPYAEAAAALARIGSLSEAAEVHGMLCGWLCADDTLAPADWLARAADEIADQPLTLDADLSRLLRRLFAVTRGQLEDAGLALELYLPDDDQDLVRRTAALGEWCQGFIYGLGRGGGRLAALPAEAREFLDDVRQISQVGFDAENAEEADEVAFTEVIEYVRMGALLVFAALHTAPGGRSGTLH